MAAAAKAVAGWYAEVYPHTAAPPFVRDYFFPVLLVAMTIAVALIGAVLNRFSLIVFQSSAQISC